MVLLQMQLVTWIFLLAVLTCLTANAAIDFRNNACTDLFSYHLAFTSGNCVYNPDVLSNVEDVVARRGYSVKTHSVVTSDGYILNVFHIGSKNVSVSRPPVFVQHGIATNSGPWVDITNRSLAFNLVDNGYDVWLGNVRGSTYSTGHVNLTVDDPNYWNFTLDTIAKNDIDVQLKLVENMTEAKGKIIYIGHSMGTTLGFMYASKYMANNTVQALITFAPVVYLNGTLPTALVKLVGFILVDVLGTLQIKGLAYQNFLHNILVSICKPFSEICREVLNILFGTSKLFLPEDLLLYYSYWPAGASIYQFNQYIQYMSSGKFQMYDYGSDQNKKEYGSENPPLYNLSSVTIPVHFFYGPNDSLYKKENLQRAYNELGSTEKKIHRTPASGYGFDHIDFLYAKSLVEALYDPALNVMAQYN